MLKEYPALDGIEKLADVSKQYPWVKSADLEADTKEFWLKAQQSEIGVNEGPGPNRADWQPAPIGRLTRTRRRAQDDLHAVPTIVILPSAMETALTRRGRPAIN